MDKLKDKLGPAIKYAFWGVWAVVMLTAIGVWWMATSSLAANTKSQKTAIEGAYSTLTQIRGTASTHPNPFSHEEMEKRVEVVQQDVLEAWQRQWEYQEKILVWPTELNKRGTNDFVDAFSKYLPIETTTEFPMPELAEVDQTLRKRYKEYIEGQLPGLAEVVGAKWTADFKAASNAGGMGRGMGTESGFGESMMSPEMGTGGPEGSGTPTPKEPDTLVTWSTSSQSTLMEQVFPWRTKEAPLTLDILYSQEDLWVLKNLLQIISTVNGNATKPFQATIHEIVEIKLGRAVAGRVGKISRGGARQSGGDGMMDEGMMGGDAMGESAMGEDMYGESGMMGEGADGAGMGGGGGGTAVDPAEKRYVNTAYEPISAAELRSAMEGKSPENAFLNVAKRLPVKMTLKMDQRKLPQLLSACGNAPLMVEVRQVRINTSGGGSPAGGGMGMETGSGGGMGFGDLNMGGEEMGGENMGAAAGGGRAEEYPFDLPIEVYGVIYIYNPPDLEKLGVEEVNTETVVDDQSIGEAPVPAAAGETVTAEASTAPVASPPVVDPPQPADAPVQPAEETGQPAEEPADAAAAAEPASP